MPFFLFFFLATLHNLWNLRSPTQASAVKARFSCAPLCDPMECSPLGSSVHGSLQARTLEFVAISYSREVFLTQGSSLHLLCFFFFFFNVNSFIPLTSTHFVVYIKRSIEFFPCDWKLTDINPSDAKGMWCTCDRLLFVPVCMKCRSF